MSILTILTLAAVAVVVLVLVVYLVGIAFYLWQADRHLAELVEGLRAVRNNAHPLPEHLHTINGALKALRDDLRGTNRHLEGAGQTLERE
ncbi:MAG: hypothetical protein M3N00_09770 [Actinomycetota bacterium]|nr:hypothetical protein [Actinomycetota bacterium]